MIPETTQATQPTRATTVVTGGARGIGRAIGLALARHGFAVAPVDVLADALEEPAETFEVRVRSVSRAQIADGIAVVTIAAPPIA